VIVVTVVLSIAYGVYMSKSQDERNNAAARLMESRGFHVTNSIGELMIDEDNKKWTIGNCGTVYDYSDLIDVSVSENGVKTKISGGVGAGVGIGSTSLYASSSRKVQTTIRLWTIDITVKSPSNPLVQIVLYNGSPIKMGEFAYNSIDLLKNKYLAQLNYIKSVGEKSKNTVNVWQIIQDNSPKTEKKKASREKESSQKIDITTKIVGVTKENDKGINIQTLLPTLSDESDVILSREKDNPYDENAIKVVADYQHIGYLKASVAEEVAPVIDSGRKVYVEILDITGGDDKKYGCNIRVFSK
jgi:hypothetical protein